jgi:hypothetical protein
MNDYEAHDTLGEVHRELDQLSRVTIAGLLQVSEVVARRGASRAAARRGEQVAMAKAAAQLEADFAEAAHAGPSGTARRGRVQAPSSRRTSRLEGAPQAGTTSGPRLPPPPAGPRERRRPDCRP